MNPADPPPFFHLDEFAFQEMCRDILEREEGVRTCEVYGVRGQAQRGIDLKAVTHGNTLQTGQCKCYEHLSANEIKKAGDAFFTHLSFWKQKHVKRFILFVASSLDTTQQQDEIDKQTERFANEGIVFEPWSSRTLRTKLKDHRDIVFRYTRSNEWVDNICGPTIDKGETKVLVQGASVLVESVISSQLSIYADSLSTEIDDKLERIRKLYRKGCRREAYTDLVGIRESSSWTILENSLKAKILRVQAGYRLDMYADIAGARELADEAIALQPDGNETLVRAFITYYVDGPLAALTLVESPKETGTLNARVAFLLELGRSSDALKEIKDAKEALQDLETRRLHALALLASRDLDEARNVINGALEIEPTWEFLRFTSAVIDYFSCIAPTSLPGTLVYWPEPPSWAIIRNDDKTRARLKRAEQTFQALFDSTEKGEDWQRVLGIWRLACIANDSSRQVEARDFCRELLAGDPTDFRAFAWAQVRNLDVDFQHSEQAFKELGASEEDLESRLPAIGALINSYLHQGQSDAARELVDRYREKFSTVGAQSNLTRWYIQILIASGQTQDAIEKAKQERDPQLRQSLLLIALRADAEAGNDWRAYLKQLERYYRRTKRGDYLVELCWIHAERDQWDYIADRSKELVNAVQTPAAVRLAANALWRTRRKEKCLRLLTSCMRYFPKRILPGDLWRLKVECQSSKGAFVEAISEAKELVRTDQSTENIVTLMQAQLRYGDLKAFSVTARELIRRRDAGPETLVKAARWVALEDPELAKRLWRQAQVGDPVSSDPLYLTGMIEAGYLLGLDSETAPLLMKAQKLSTQGMGSLRRLTIDDFIAQQRERIDHITELQRDYERGVFPLHVLTNSFNRTLVDLMHGLPQDSGKTFRPLRQPRIFLRHGGRSTNNQFATSSTSWRLCPDVSAIIIANHLGLLDVIERSFKPLMISPSLMTALLLQQQNLQSIQPSQIEKCNAILQLVEKKVISCIQVEPTITADLKDLIATMGEQWVADLHQAYSQQGFLIDHLPLQTRTPPIRPITLAAPYDTRVIGIKTLLQSLRAHGWVSPEAYIDARISPESQNHLIPENTKLFFYGNAIESAHELGVLAALCEHYDVAIDPVYLNYAKGVSQTSKYLADLRIWLQQLIERLREGLTAGTYQCVDVVDEYSPDEPEDDSGFADAATIRELLSKDLPVGSMVWIDDRHINRYLKTESAPIIGINEVLSALRFRGDITEPEFFEKLIKLRRGNYRYIPTSSEEILWHLVKAPIVDGQLKETPGLEVLRRYIAACLLDTDSLQIIPMPPGSSEMLGEAEFILETRRALDESLVALWKAEAQAPEIAIIRANWLLSNLYTGCFGIRHLLPNTENRGDASFLMGLDIAGMITSGILMLGNPLAKEVRLRRQAFLEWYENRVMLPRLTANPETAEVAASMVSSFITHAASEEYNSQLEAEGSRLIKHMLFSELPTEIKSEIELSQSVMDWIGARHAQTVHIGDHDFEQEVFAIAIETLMKGTKEIQIVDFLESGTFVLRVVSEAEDGTPVIELIDGSPDTKETVLARLKDEFLTMASPDIEERKAVLRRNRHWFDCNGDTFETQILPIAHVPEVNERMLQVQNWRKKSVEVFYRELESKLTRCHEFNWSDLVPSSAQGLLNHFRLPTDQQSYSDFSGLWEGCTRNLLSDEGLEIAMDRVALAPIRIPEFLVQAVRDLSSIERQSFLERCAIRWTSPIARLQFADLSIRASDSASKPSPVVMDAISELYDEDGLNQYKLFEALLRFVNDRFSNVNDAEVLCDASQLILIWAHAARLHDLFNSLNADITKLTAILTSFISSQSASEVLHRHEGVWRDVLYWRRFNREIFLTHGICAVLGTHGLEITEALGLKEKIDQACFREDDRSRLIPLMRDPAVTTNLTESFLGGDHSKTIGSATGENFEGLSSESLRTLVVRALEKLEEDPIDPEWGTFDLVFGDLPCYPDVSERLKQLVTRMDFRVAYEQDPFVALISFRVASNQAIYWNDDALRAELERTLLELLRLSSKDPDGSSRYTHETRMESLLEGALRLSIRLNNPQESSRQFSRNLRKILDVVPDVVKHFGAGFVELLLQLPAAQLHGMWPFLLAVRATADKPL